MSRPNPSSFRIGCAALLFCIAASASAQSPEEVAARYPAGTIATTETADRALAEASGAREAVERRFSEEQANCYTRFFATSCMDESRERRRKALTDIRAVEVQANEFKRRERAAERDREVAQRIADSEAKRVERERQMQLQQERAVNVPAKADDGRTAAQRDAAPVSEKPDRAVRHEAKLRKMQAEEAADAERRARNVAAYERKQKEAEAHLKEVESRKLEKERARKAAAASSASPAGASPQ